MACACSGARKAAAARAAGTTFVYDFLPPNSPEGTAPTVFSSYLEAKREIRRYGGGEVYRRSVPTTAA